MQGVDIMPGCVWGGGEVKEGGGGGGGEGQGGEVLERTCMLVLEGERWGGEGG